MPSQGSASAATCLPELLKSAIWRLSFGVKAIWSASHTQRMSNGPTEVNCGVVFWVQPVPVEMQSTKESIWVPASGSVGGAWRSVAVPVAWTFAAIWVLRAGTSTAVGVGAGGLCVVSRPLTRSVPPMLAATRIMTRSRVTKTVGTGLREAGSCICWTGGDGGGADGADSGWLSGSG